mmetsp:Transcript_15656/g.29251  ORF Transcript_15656/g.29251 Transcript_15656/m.29251 type:complete len:293 (-) Transcript_15656:53-931(-)
MSSSEQPPPQPPSAINRNPTTGSSTGSSNSGSSNSKKSNDLTVGIIGGMGPQATVSFLQLLISLTHELTSARTDQDHVKYILVNDPTIPNRQSALLSSSPSSLSTTGLHISSACSLLPPSVDFCICICNTAHAFSSYFTDPLSLHLTPFLSLITVTSKRVIELSEETTKVAILAATGCVKSRLYQNELGRLGGRAPYILPDSLQETAMLSINQTKAGEIDEACRTLGPLLRFLREEEEVEMVVLGCTEFPVIVESLGEDVPEGIRFVDSTMVMAEMTVKLCKGLIKLEDVME